MAIATLALVSSAQSNSPPPQPPPPTEITIGAQDQGRRIQLREGEVLVVSLEANPSTGYGWWVEQVGLAAQGSPILVQTGSEFLAPEPPGSLEGIPALPILGAPTMQTLRFQAAEAGKTILRLTYRRPWETHVPPARNFSLEVEATGPFTGPAPVPLTAEPSSSQPTADLGADGQLGLPSSFNWCTQGFCTPVKNQGNCGSCWAFSTVGVLESNILYKDGSARDLSEQYLLSCNTEQNPPWNCNGGWFAHDYHQWKIPPDEPEAGAVYEAELSYTAQEDPCNPPHSHCEKTAHWDYVGNWWSVPSVADIKQAILDHGPVAAAVCAGTAFASYGGGVFQTNEVCSPYDVNHAVVLVGWDDNQAGGIWYLRNSWSTGWGEGGYMRIGYGISKVGYAANYVVYCHELDTAVYPVGAGTISADPPTCEAGAYEPHTDVDLVSQASLGWHFLYWGGDASGSDEQTTVTMDFPKSVAAYFMCNNCTPQAYLPLVIKN